MKRKGKGSRVRPPPQSYVDYDQWGHPQKHFFLVTPCNGRRHGSECIAAGDWRDLACGHSALSRRCRPTRPTVDGPRSSPPTHGVLAAVSTGPSEVNFVRGRRRSDQARLITYGELHPICVDCPYVANAVRGIQSVANSLTTDDDDDGSWTGQNAVRPAGRVIRWANQNISDPHSLMISF